MQSTGDVTFTTPSVIRYRKGFYWLMVACLVTNLVGMGLAVYTGENLGVRSYLNVCMFLFLLFNTHRTTLRIGPRTIALTSAFKTRAVNWSEITTVVIPDRVRWLWQPVAILEGKPARIALGMAYSRVVEGPDPIETVRGIARELDIPIVSDTPEGRRSRRLLLALIGFAILVIPAAAVFTVLS